MRKTTRPISMFVHKPGCRPVVWTSNMAAYKEQADTGKWMSDRKTMQLVDARGGCWRCAPRTPHRVNGLLT